MTTHMHKLPDLESVFARKVFAVAALLMIVATGGHVHATITANNAIFDATLNSLPSAQGWSGGWSGGSIVTDGANGLAYHFQGDNNQGRWHSGATAINFSNPSGWTFEVEARLLSTATTNSFRNFVLWAYPVGISPTNPAVWMSPEVGTGLGYRNNSGTPVTVANAATANLTGTGTDATTYFTWSMTYDPGADTLTYKVDNTVLGTVTSPLNGDYPADGAFYNSAGDLEWGSNASTNYNVYVRRVEFTAGAASVIPEPTTVALAVLATFGLVLAGWRRKSR